MSNWSGHLFVTRTVDGISRIGNSMPPGIPLDFGVTEVYEIVGPFALIEGPGMIETPDSAAWLKEREKGGFGFKKVGENPHQPQSDLAKKIDPAKQYTAKDIADLFGKPVAQVEHWMNNWSTSKHPRLHHRMDGEKKCNAYQLLKLIQDYGPYLK
jgi:hypothetical protein